ncbi:uncharacterized protein B0H64DRAFT_399185 [Chaetomium fimeti]|uniref:Uncharacterized protein n=1 Tax=Chaetomium fimeti TaxID=1854472 RepID=A0AAE0LQQ6_9PEZI|nr:hypothetical protein B0H64DRAFT_399185 [Chaetomium fimeti]
MSVTASIEGYYRDLRKCVPSDVKPDRRLAYILATHLPFPNGVVTELVRSTFLRAHTDQRAEEIANAYANGAAFDSLLILLRLLLAVCPEFRQSSDYRLFTLAFHDFGQSWVDDYMVKGKLLELLYPTESDQLKRVDVTLGELIWHPLISRALWSHPSLSFFRRQTWVQRPGMTKFEPYELDDKFARVEIPFQVQDQNGPIDLGKHFSRKLGIRNIDGSSVAFAGLMPPTIPVIIKGGQPFNSIRTFAIEGPSDYRPVGDGTIAPMTVKRQYRLRAVLNLADGGVHTYHQDTAPVVEQLDPELSQTTGIPQERYLAKLQRAEHARRWTFEDSPTRFFLLIYVEYNVPGRLYRPVSNQFGEYIPPIAGNGTCLVRLW